MKDEQLKWGFEMTKLLQEEISMEIGEGILKYQYRLWKGVKRIILRTKIPIRVCI